MKIRGYEVIEKEDRILVKGVCDFDPVQIFECGQCFRWTKQKDGSYTGIVRGSLANVGFHDGILEICHANPMEFENLWFDYLDLGRDCGSIKKFLGKDPVMAEAIRFGSGMRILRQDFWEVLVSFILSSNNNVPRIKQIVESISRMYGAEGWVGEQQFFSFPEPWVLTAASAEELNLCRGGYRCRYISETAKRMNEICFDQERTASLTTAVARAEIMKFPGVGPKVADCVLLYSGMKQDVFPTDVWVKRVMETLYFKRSASMKEIQQFAKDRFGLLAGFAQQYLFYYARENSIGT